MSVSAATFYVSPEGAGEKTGADVANAMGVDEFVSQVNADGYQGGDVYNFAEGDYEFTSTVKVPSGKNISLIAEDGQPATFIWKGEQSAKGEACIIYYNGAANAVNIKNINFTGVTTKIDRTADNEKLIFGALLLHNCSKTTVENCRFYGNTAEGTLGGVALNIFGCSGVTLKNCKIENNTVKARAAVYLHSDATSRGTTVIEKCLFNGNTSTDLGAALFVQHAVALVVNGCVFANNESTGASARGSVIYANGSANINDKNSYADKIYFINNTIADNPNENGAQIFMAENGHLWLMNNIIVSRDDSRAISTPSIKFANASKANLVSGGYNYVGTSVNTPDSWQTTDVLNKDYTSIFNTRTLTASGKLKPYAAIQGASSDEIAAATASWGLPAGVTFDERGTNVTAGAYGYDLDNVTTGIADIAGDVDNVRIVALGGANYQVLGHEGMVEVYSISGALVLTAAAPEVSLGSLAPGVYLIRAGRTVEKVIR